MSAQGVADVIAAFTRVRQEGKQAGQDTASGFNLASKAISGLTALLPAITFAGIAAGLGELVKGAFDTVVSLEKLSEKTGISVEMLSVFSLAAKESGVDTDVLAKGLAKLTKGTQDAADGSAKQAKGFKDLGITIADINTKDPGALFVEIATKLQGIQDPGLKAQAAVAIFGRAGQELLPVLNRLGVEGLDVLTQRAKRFGVYIGGDLAQSAKDAQVGIANVEAEVQGAALEFTAGLLPAVIGVTNALADMAGGAEGFKQWGKDVGAAAFYVAAGFAEIIRDVRVAAATVDEYTTKARIPFYKSALALPQTDASRTENKQILGQLQNSVNDDKIEKADANAEYEKGMNTLAEGLNSLDHPKPSTPSPTPHPSAHGTGIDQKQADKDQAARSALAQSQAENELNYEKLTNSLEEAEDKRHYDAGLETLDQYYDQRAQRINAGADAEIAALDQKRSAAERLPTTTVEQQSKRAEEIGKINEQEKEIQLKRNADLVASEDQRSADKKANAQKELEDQEKLQRAAGDLQAAQQTALQIEIQQYTELLQKQGKSVDEIKAATDAYRVRGEAKIKFENLQQRGSDSSAGLSQATELINAQAANGSISGIAAQAKINQLQHDYLVTQDQINADLLKAAQLSGDPKLVAAANAQIAAAKVQHAALQANSDVLTYISNQLATQGRSAVEDFFAEGISGAKSFGDAMKDLADVFEQMVARMVAKLLIFYALEAVLGWINPDSDSSLGQFKDNLDTAGPFGKYASGGWTGGSAGQPAGIVHGEEYVIQAGPAAKYRSLLDAINNGTALPAMTAPGSPIASTSSAVDAVSAAPGGGGTVVNIHTTEPTTQTQSTSSNGTNIIDVVVGKAKAAVHQDIASGGPIAKQMEGQYALSRGGVRRG